MTTCIFIINYYAIYVEHKLSLIDNFILYVVKIDLIEIVVANLEEIYVKHVIY